MTQLRAKNKKSLLVPHVDNDVLTEELPSGYEKSHIRAFRINNIEDLVDAIITVCDHEDYTAVCLDYMPRKFISGLEQAIKESGREFVYK